MTIARGSRIVPAVVVLLAACSSGGGARARSTTATTATSAARHRVTLHLDWSAPLTPPSKGIDFVTDGVAAAADGTVYVVDAMKREVRHYDATGRVIGSWGRAGAGAGEFDFQRFTETVLLGGIAVDAAGHVFVTETGNGRIQEFDGSGRFLRFVGAPGAGRRGFVRVVGVALDARGSIYATDGDDANPIQKFDRSGRFVTEWGATAGTGNGIAKEGGAPVGVSANGTVYAPDNVVSDVLVFDSTGGFRFSFGSPATASQASAADGALLQPQGAAVDDHGTVYVADSGNNRICAYDPHGRFLWASTGEPGGPGHLRSVSSLSVRSPGRLFVVDDGQFRLLSFTVT